MVAIIDRGFALLNRITEPAATTSVEYQRGGDVLVASLTAHLSAPQIEVITEGHSIIGRQFVWRMRRSELPEPTEGVEKKPRRGDKIVWTLNDNTYTFEVLPEINQAEVGPSDPRSEWVTASFKLTAVGTVEA